MKKIYGPKLFEAFVGNLSTIGINLLFPLVVTKIYGETILGEYTYNASILMMLIFFASLGLSTGLMYYIPREGKKYITSSFVITLVLTSTIVILGLVLSSSKSMDMMLPLLFIYSFEQLFFAIFRARHQIKEYFYTNIIIHNLLKVLLAFLYGYYYRPTIEGLILVSYISGGLALIIYLFKQYDMLSKFVFSLDVIKYSLPLSIGSVLLIIMMQLDKVMLGTIVGKEAVAIYGVAAILATFPSIFLTTLNIIFPPIIAKMYHDGEYVKLKTYYKKSVKYLVLVSGITILIIIFFRKNLLSLYGDLYIEGATALIFISIGQFVNAAVGSVWYIVIMTGHPRINLLGKVSALLINVTLNAVLIPIWGINGASLATMASTSFSNILGFFIVRHILNESVKIKKQPA